jgi:hypothetical protein
MKGRLNINDDKGLEREADIMGAKALQMKSRLGGSDLKTTPLQMKTSSPFQLKGDEASEDYIKVKAPVTPDLEAHLKDNNIFYEISVPSKGWLGTGAKVATFHVSKAQHDALVAKGLIEDKNAPEAASSGPDAA